MDEILKELREIGKKLNDIEIGRQRKLVTVKVGGNKYIGKEFDWRLRELRNAADEIGKAVSWLEQHTKDDRHENYSPRRDGEDDDDDED